MSDLADLLIEHIGTILSATQEIKSTRGRSKIDAGSLYGINRLRRLILDLALKGKLVEQIDALEFSRHQAQRREFFTEDKSENQHRVTKSSVENQLSFDVLNDMPRGWTLGRLGDIASLITKGTTPTSIGYAYQAEGIRFIKVENISDGHINTSSINQYISEEADNALSRSSLRKNDLLFSIAGTIGRVGIVRDSDLPANTNQALAIIRGTDKVLYPPFLLRQLNSFVADQIRNKARGGAMNNVSLSDLSDAFLVIPPHEEQIRICEKVDELMALCNKLENRQNITAELHQLLVESSLADFIEAAEAPDSDGYWKNIFQNFDHLFTTIASIESLDKAFIQLGVMGAFSSGKIGKVEILQNPPLGCAEVIDGRPIQIPGSWSWLSFGELIESAYTGLDKGKAMQSDTHEYAYFKMNNITPDGICDMSTMTRVNASLDEVSKYALKANDFLFNTRNSRELVGKTCVVNFLQEDRIIFNNNILRVQFKSGIDPRFINLWFHSPTGKELLESIKSSTTNVCAIYQGNLFKLLCPVPPLDEQRQIVSKTQELLSMCAQIKSQIHLSKDLERKIADLLVGQAIA